MIPDAAAHAFSRLGRDAYYPINHTVVIKDEVLQRYPHVAAELFETFGAAKRLYLERLRTGEIGAPSAADAMYARVLEITRRDPLPYGIEPNRAMLETLLGYAREQGILPRRFALEEVFAPGTAGLTA